MTTKVKKKRVRSLSKMIAASLLVLVAIIGVVGFAIVRSVCLNFMHTYFEDALITIAPSAEDCVADYYNQENGAQERMERLGSEFEELCKFDLVEMAFVTVLSDNEGYGESIIFATKDASAVVGSRGELLIHPLYEFEREVMFGGGYAKAIAFDDEKSGKLFAYCTGFTCTDASTGATKRVAIGLAVKESVIMLDSMKLILSTVGPMILLSLVFTVVAVFLFSRRVFGPIERISQKMASFVDDGELASFEPIDYRYNDEIGQMAGAFNTMAEDIRGYISKVTDYEGERQRTLAEMGIAKDIQMGLLPKGRFQDDVFAVRGFTHSARNVGGDLFYYERLEDGKLAFAVGDVSGKGIVAALFMARAISSIKYNLRIEPTPARALTATNNELSRENPQQLFVTVFAGVVDADAGTLTYSNGGHNPPFLVGERLAELQGAHGLLLGLFEDEEYEDCVVDFGPGDRVFLFTDGVTEAANGDNEFFGQERLLEVLALRPADLISSVDDAIKAFVGDADQHDDVTMLEVGLSVSRLLEGDVGKKPGCAKRDDAGFEDAKRDGSDSGCTESSGTESDSNDRDGDEPDSAKRSITLAAEAKSVRALKEFIMGIPALDAAFLRKMYLACEEIFVNTYSYGYPDGKTGTVNVSVEVAKESVAVRFEDDAMPFDPITSVREAGDYDPDFELGGLGRLMAFAVMDESTYSYEDGKNILVMRKNR